MSPLSFLWRWKTWTASGLAGIEGPQAYFCSNKNAEGRAASSSSGDETKLVANSPTAKITCRFFPDERVRVCHTWLRGYMPRWEKQSFLKRAVTLTASVLAVPPASSIHLFLMCTIRRYSDRPHQTKRSTYRLAQR
jgi:hypothetical protein